MEKKKYLYINLTEGFLILLRSMSKTDGSHTRCVKTWINERSFKILDLGMITRNFLNIYFP